MTQIIWGRGGTKVLEGVVVTDSPRMTSCSRHSPHHAGNGFLNSPAADVARPDKISGADINSICQEVSDGFSLDPGVLAAEGVKILPLSDHSIAVLSLVASLG